MDGQHRPEFLKTLLEEYALAGKPRTLTAIDIPEDTFHRILRHAPTVSDVLRVMGALSKAWALSPSNPQVFEEFLARKGVKIRYKSPNSANVKLPSDVEMAQYRESFNAEWRKVVSETEFLIEYLVAGPFLVEFLDELRGLSSALRELVYRTAIRSGKEQARVLILSALSRESPRLWEETLAAVPRDPVIDSFRMFMRDPNSSLSLSQPTSELNAESQSTVGTLFRIASFAIVDQGRAIEELTEPTRKLLLDCAATLYDLLPDIAFGSFALNRLAVFICLAEPKAERARRAVERLIAASHPTTADLLVFMRDPELLAKAFADLPDNITERHSAYAARLVDAVRIGPLQMLEQSGPRLSKWSQSKVPLVAMAAQAALLNLNQGNKAQLNKTLLRVARSDKTNSIGSWLENNSDLLAQIDIARLPSRIWKHLIARFAASEPRRVETVINGLMKGASHSRYLKDVVQTLATVQSAPVDSVLQNLLRQELSKGINTELLNDTTIHTIIRRYFWSIIEDVEASRRLEVFDAIVSGIHAREVFSFLQSGLTQSRQQSDTALSDCIANSFVPLALSEGRIGPVEVQEFSDDSFKQQIASSLVEKALKDWVFLLHFPGTWRSRRAELKKQISSRVETGLQVALLNSKRDSSLGGTIEGLAGEVRRWIDRDSPTMDRSLEIANNMGIPQKLTEGSATLESFFLKQPTHPQELILFLAQNNWALPYLSLQRGSWPTFNIILEQLTKSYVFIRSLRTRGEADIANLSIAILTDLAITIRQSVSNIEEQLAGYFAFRQVLGEIGIRPVADELGAAISELDQGTEEKRLLRDPGRQGKYRIFSLGMKINKKVVDVAMVAKSGVDDDRD
jgi:DNA-binding FrmR family transcriptional regulator